MGNPDAEPDAGAHGGLAFFDDGGDLIAVVRLDLAGLHQVANQFVNGLPAVGGQHLSNDLRRTEDVTQVHTDFVAAAAFRLNSTGFTRANSASFRAPRAPGVFKNFAGGARTALSAYFPKF